jgi:hypothetical protein
VLQVLVSAILQRLEVNEENLGKFIINVESCISVFGFLLPISHISKKRVRLDWVQNHR